MFTASSARCSPSSNWPSSLSARASHVRQPTEKISGRPKRAFSRSPLSASRGPPQHLDGARVLAGRVVDLAQAQLGLGLEWEIAQSIGDGQGAPAVRQPLLL